VLINQVLTATLPDDDRLATVVAAVVTLNTALAALPGNGFCPPPPRACGRTQSSTSPPS
jgi:hypothetical protein